MQNVDFIDKAPPLRLEALGVRLEGAYRKGNLHLEVEGDGCPGNVQPDHHDERFGTYVIHHTFGIEVVVR
jgi:hypothetical protein